MVCCLGMFGEQNLGVWVASVDVRLSHFLCYILGFSKHRIGTEIAGLMSSEVAMAGHGSSSVAMKQ